jgi:Ser/Thr protein kinase RdoA (MazF antagonist)
MAATGMPLEVLLGHLEDLANRSLGLWDVPPGARARLVNVSENATYLVEAAGGFRSVLRVHREAYHSRRAIECELAWIAALDAAGTVPVSGVHPGRDGEAIQEARHPALAKPRFMVMFRFVPGSAPNPDDDLVEPFRNLGGIAARMHRHAIAWRRPEPFERLTWDVDAVFGPRPTWGDWRDGPGVTPAIRAVLEDCEAMLRARLEAYGKGPDRYGLIHADMRLANLLVGEAGTWLIDFDDCGMGWFLYDFAAGVSFMEDHPQVPALKQAWLAGYRRVRPLAAADEAEIDTFVMLRRMALLAWIGSHIEAPEPQAMAPTFAPVTAQLARAWMARLRKATA